MSTLTDKRFVDLPGIAKARVDANTVVCARIENAENGSFVVIHTDKGFAFGVIPDTDLSVNDVYQEVLKILWPPGGQRKTVRTTK